MKEKGLAFIQKWLNDFKNFSAGQKAATVAAVLAIVIGGLVFATHKPSADYAPLYTNLSATDASAVIDKLNSAGTPYKLTNAGSEIQVPKADVYSSRITLASDGLPANSQSGYSLLDKEGVTTSQFQQQVDLQQANQTELNNTIKQINGIQNANVHLAIPQQDVFNDDTTKPTASVVVTTDGMTQLTNQQIRTIAYLVSSSVPGMSSSDVTITDQTGRLLAAAGDDSGLLAGGTSTQDDATTAYNTRIKNELQDMIDAAVGAGHAKVVYNATLNFDKQTQTSQNYLYSSGVPPVSVETSSERYSGTQDGQSGVLGAGPTPTTAAGTTGAGSYAKDSSVVNNALGTVTDTIQKAPGQLQAQHISVMLDSATPNVDTAAIQQLVSAAVGLNTGRGDTLQVNAVAFDTTQQTAQAKAAAAAAAAADKQKKHDQLMSEVKQGLVAGVVLIAIGIFLLIRRRRHKAAQQPPAEPYEPWFDDSFLPVEPAAELEEPSMSDELAEAQARRRALVTLAEEQPDDVARVLSGWLNS